jgi:hypothetical protein
MIVVTAARFRVARIVHASADGLNVRSFSCQPIRGIILNLARQSVATRLW